MATQAFIQGGTGIIQLGHLPSMQHRGFIAHHEQRTAADLYEAEHPGVSVNRPWLTPQENADHAAKRKQPTAAEPTLTMDPARVEPRLRAKQRELSGLTSEHPDYEKLFMAMVAQIHEMERAMGRQPTKYVRGVAPKKAEDPRSPEAIAKKAKFGALKADKKAASIAATEDVEFLELIQNDGADPTSQAQAMARIVELKSAASSE